jgi:hypothetical protein
MNSNKAPQTTADDAPVKPADTAIYEVTCHSVEIGELLCYRTHRLRLTKEQSAALNDAQPETVRFVGI